MIKTSKTTIKDNLLIIQAVLSDFNHDKIMANVLYLIGYMPPSWSTTLYTHTYMYNKVHGNKSRILFIENITENFNHMGLCTIWK